MIIDHQTTMNERSNLKKKTLTMAALDCINNHMHQAAEHMYVFATRHWIYGMTWPLFMLPASLQGWSQRRGGTSSQRLEPSGARREWGRV